MLLLLLLLRLAKGTKPSLLLRLLLICLTEGASTAKQACASTSCSCRSRRLSKSTKTSRRSSLCGTGVTEASEGSTRCSGLLCGLAEQASGGLRYRRSAKRRLPESSCGLTTLLVVLLSELLREVRVRQW